MNTAGNIDFIFLDDAEIDNLISRMTVEMTVGNDHLSNSFTNPIQALAFLRNYSCRTGVKGTVLFLDINMPIMSGWEFLVYFNNLPAETKDIIHVYVLSSSVDQRDRERSYSNINVRDFLVKPLTKEAVERVVRAFRDG